MYIPGICPLGAMYHSLRNSINWCLANSGSTLANGSMWKARSQEAYCNIRREGERGREGVGESGGREREARGRGKGWRKGGREEREGVLLSI